MFYSQIFGTIAVACVIKAQYGGWSALSPDTFLRPEFYQTPSREQQVRVLTIRTDLLLLDSYLSDHMLCFFLCCHMIVGMVAVRISSGRGNLLSCYHPANLCSIFFAVY